MGVSEGEHASKQANKQARKQAIKQASIQASIHGGNREATKTNMFEPKKPLKVLRRQFKEMI